MLNFNDGLALWCHSALTFRMRFLSWVYDLHSLLFLKDREATPSGFILLKSVKWTLFGCKAKVAVPLVLGLFFSPEGKTYLRGALKIKEIRLR
jgi:hypothetical protein